MENCMNYEVIYGKNQSVYTDFLALPCKLYQKNDLTQDYDTEYKLLSENHILSKYFKCTPFVVIDKNAQIPVARCMLTYYPEDDVAYFGFFESIDDQKIVDLLLDTISEKAEKDGKVKLEGPVDASFWIKYRLKMNLFDKIPYTGEPYNKDYYYQLLTNYGFIVQNHYTSNIYPVIDAGYHNQKFQKRYEQFRDNGYEIKSPDKKNYQSIMEKVYELIMDLYSDFPAFKYIEKDDFMKLFSSYKYILDFDMVKIAFYKEKIVGFFISVPNYKNLPYKLNVRNFFKILQIKHRPDEYVMLYVGVDRKHVGLGNAMSNIITMELKKKQVPSIGALVRDGKITQSYASELIQDRYEYVLLEKKL